VAAGSARQARDEPVIEGAGAAPASGGPATPARVVRRGDTAVDVHVRARQPGQLVLLDTFYPGWQAEVDGREAPIHPANAAFRGVPVGAGQHVVRFRYRPASVRVGAAISVVSLLALAIALAGSELMRRRPRPGGP
jgi:hypothetical protein